MMNITLINPPDKSIYSKFKRSKIKRLPLGLAYIAAFLEKDGHQVNVVDAEALDMDAAVAAIAALDTDPQMVGTTATTPIIHTSLGILREIKKRNPHIYTLIGGPHISALPEETLSANQAFLDFVVFGEGENSCLELIQSIETGTVFSHPLSGVGYVDNNQSIVMGPKRQFEKDLDNFPFPARHLFPMNAYVDHTKFDAENYVLLTSSRGCPSLCTFCGSQATWGRKVRFRSPQNVVDEIRECVERFGVSNIVFCDDTFTLRKEHVVNVCKKIIELPYPVKIFCSSRADTICKERLEWLKKAGCYCISFGIESGDEDIIKLMKKRITVEMVKHAVAITRDAGIDVHGSFIIGNLGDTDRTIEKTIRFANSLDLNQVQFSILVPLPGTECYQKALEMGAIEPRSNDFKQFYWYYSVAANLTDIPSETLLAYQKQAYDQWNATRLN